MRKYGFLILGVSSCILLSGVAFAQTKDMPKAKSAVPAAAAQDAAKKQAAPAAPPAPVAQAPTAQDLKNNEALENAKTMLASKEWVVSLSMPNGKKPKTTSDVLTFKDGKVAAKNLVAQGYPESNYTLTVNADGVAVWETMQVNEKVGLAFLRGELQGAVMKGAISMQPQKGEKSTLYFNSEASVEQAQAAPVAVDQQPPKKKGKK